MLASIAPAEFHTCALNSGGGVWCWGDNESGQLGDAKASTGQYPVQPVGLTSGVSQIAAGYVFTCALLTNGHVTCWGDNSSGQLGTGDTSPATVPAAVLASPGVELTGVTAIAAGGYHTCALMTDTTVKCWGNDFDGQLGDAGNTDSSVPVTVVTGLGGPALTGVTAIAGGGYHTCAVVGGAAMCWGLNEFGQLGNDAGPTFANSNVPVSVSGLASGVDKVIAGNDHSCALTTGGAVSCWGYNFFGQLGNGGNADSDVPVAVTGMGSGVNMVAAGYYHTCALTTGAVKCWGDDGFGQLGDDTDLAGKNVPTAVFGPLTGIGAIGSRYDHTCSVTTTGSALCWGPNSDGQLGDGTTTDSPIPVSVVFGP
jgi:alpha-tubulin suppressor-like RCC1 family protein